MFTYPPQATTALHIRDQRPTGITEIVLPDQNDLSLVLPSLAFLTNHFSDSWLTWISHSPKIDRSQLQFFGFNLSRVRVVHPKNSEQAFRLLWEALAAGNSHTVIGTPGDLSDWQLAQLDRAAKTGECTGLILRSRRTRH